MTVAVIADTWKLHQARHNLLAWKLKLQSNSLDEQGNVRELDGLTDNSVSLSLWEWFRLYVCLMLSDPPYTSWVLYIEYL